MSVPQFRASLTSFSVYEKKERREKRKGRGGKKSEKKKKDRREKKDEKERKRKREEERRMLNLFHLYRYHELVTLPDDFSEQLMRFLRPYPDLAWLQFLHCQKFAVLFWPWFLVLFLISWFWDSNFWFGFLV
jgi:hypothetical protein